MSRPRRPTPRPAPPPHCSTLSAGIDPDSQPGSPAGAEVAEFYQRTTDRGGSRRPCSPLPRVPAVRRHAPARVHGSGRFSWPDPADRPPVKGFVHTPTEAGAHDPQEQGKVALTWAALCPPFQQADTQARPLCTHSHARVSARGPNCPRPIHSSQPAPQVASSPVGETESPGRNDDPPRRFRDLSQQAPLTLDTPRRSPLGHCSQKGQPPTSTSLGQGDPLFCGPRAGSLSLGQPEPRQLGRTRGIPCREHRAPPHRASTRRQCPGLSLQKGAEPAPKCLV